MLRFLLNITNHWRALSALFLLLRRRWELACALTRHELTERYAGEIFGLAWTIGHPMLLVATYAVVFGGIFGGKGVPDPSHPLSQTTFLLAGLVPWVVTAEYLGKAPGLITGSTNLVKRVVFPIEVLPIKGAMASVITLIVALFFVLLFSAVDNKMIMPLTLLLPIIVLFHFMFLVGIGYILSAASPFFRDLKDFVNIFLGFAVFISPVLYFNVHLPVVLSFLIKVNPFSAIIWVYQDVIWYGEFHHPYAWLTFAAMTLVTLSLGFQFFERVKHGFADVL